MAEERLTGELTGQVAIVTGGGRGIGRAVAAALAQAGAAVTITARSTTELEETAAAIAAAGGQVLACPADVRDAAAMRQVVADTTQQFGPVSLLVNNAGTPGPVGSDWEVDADAWWECIEVIVRGAFLCTQAVMPGMLARGGGRIIQMASVSGTRATVPVMATSVAKTALIRLTEGLAKAGAAQGLVCFAIHPGVVDTQLLRAYGFDRTGRTFTPPERAGALCTALASGRYDQLTGRYLTVEDNLDALLQQAEEITNRDLLTLRIAT